ncbi:MAG: TY-Chap domain-containing protein [Acidimicrobiia bacterium]
MDPADQILDALDAVAAGDHTTVLLRASSHRDRWVQATKIEGEDTFVCEAASNEYLDPADLMSGVGVARMKELGWTSVEGSDFTRFDESATGQQRRAVATMLLRTLSDVYGHDSAVAPRIEFPS